MQQAYRLGGLPAYRELQHGAMDTGDKQWVKAGRRAYKTIEAHPCRVRDVAQLRGLPNVGDGLCGVICAFHSPASKRTPMLAMLYTKLTRESGEDPLKACAMSLSRNGMVDGVRFLLTRLSILCSKIRLP